MASCLLQTFVGGRWVNAAEVRCEDERGGYRSPTKFDYDFDYLDAMAAALGAFDHRAVSCRFPLGYEGRVEATWPAFLLDLIPSGAGRRHWERELGLPNTPSSDWAILVAGGTNPPGNVRVAPLDPPPTVAHPGFARADVLVRAEHFIEYAREQGASITGGSGAGGDAPKFLLREDLHGRWHADGALADDATAACFVVKFPRSSRADDRIVLEAEAPYYRIASRLGIRVKGPLRWENDCLFVPRFDRERDPHLPALRHHGVESLCSLAGVADFGVAIPKEDLARALARFVTRPEVELFELLLRDVADVALGNTDNHARNTAVIKIEDGPIELTPLYDFAPMVLDPSGIARVCRWRTEEGGYPVWSRVAETLDVLGLDATSTKRRLRELAAAVGELPTMMKDEGVPSRVIDALESRITRTTRSLEEIE